MTRTSAPPGANGRGRPAGGGPNHSAESGTYQFGARVPLAPAIAYAPAARRSRWLGVVEVCPHCSHCHAHYGTRAEPPAGIRLAACGRLYRLYVLYGGQSTGPEVTP